MTRTKPPEQRRADLLAAGQAQFLAKGVAATSLEDITTEAGVSKGLFYLYFKSKEDLVLALQDEFSGEFAGRIRAAVAAETDWGARLDACVTASFGFYRDLHDLHEVLFHHATHREQAHQDEAGHGLVVRTIAEILTEGMAAGAFDIEDPQATAVLCYASMHAFDPDFHGGPAGSAGPPGPAMLRAAQVLFRRAAGVVTGPNQRTSERTS
jgi:TetR/AcrR family transcriptional regulator, transcriptional repressor for nem operon